MSKAVRSYLIFVIAFSALVGILAIFQFLPSTSLEPSYRYKYRYENFIKLLSDEERKLFFEGKYKECAKSLDERISNDANLRRKIQEIKEFEAIDTFTTEVMLEYFGYYVYNEVLKYNPGYRFE